MQLKTTIAAFAALALIGTLSACAIDATDTAESAPTPSVVEETPALPPVPEIDITTGAPAAGTNEALAWEALMGPDGEYAAAASYESVLNTYGQVEPYATIYQAELKHADALIRQLERAGVAVPSNPYTGKIEAPADLTTAAEAWAEGEILNVQMYDELIAQSTDASLTRVLNNLRSASLDSHLPMFELAAANGGTLTPEQMQSVNAG
jgi:hypothetical protein